MSSSYAGSTRNALMILSEGLNMRVHVFAGQVDGPFYTVHGSCVNTCHFVGVKSDYVKCVTVWGMYA